MAVRVWIVTLCSVALMGCATSSRVPANMCRFEWPGAWSPWRELLGASVSFELDDGKLARGEVTRVEFFPSTEIEIRTSNVKGGVSMSFEQARTRLEKTRYSQEYEWSRLLGKFVVIDGVEVLVTAVSLDPAQMIVVMEETGPKREYRSVPVAELLASIDAASDSDVH